MPRFTGAIYIPFDIERATNQAEAEEIINYALDLFGEHALGRMTWDNPNWSVTEVEEDITNA
jgi:hypothetical protein